MNAGDTRKDKHFPAFGLDNPLRRLLDHPDKYCGYVQPGQTVADLGCGPGFYTFALAEAVGPQGRVYAVDSDERAIRAVRKKAARREYDHVRAHVCSAADLGFIGDGSIDFVLADGLLCSMAPRDHAPAIEEMKRILKPEGKAFLQTGTGALSYVDQAEWEGILAGFTVERRNFPSRMQDGWALVSLARP